MLEENIKAPFFSLPNQNNEVMTLDDFKGSYLVLYFYPKDNTSGCTLQAQGFRDLYNEITSMGVKLVGVSKDSIKSHQNFICKQNLPFILLSDEECKMLEAYDVWKEKSMYGRKYMGVVRTTYIIDPEGIIVKTMPNVKAKENPQDVLKVLKEIIK